MTRIPFRLVSQAKIHISLAQKRLYFFQGETLMGNYPIAIGKWSTPTPIGTYSIFEKIVNPGGVFGTRWMAFYQQSGGKWGIHGTNNPASIGNAVSLGCIRMYNHDVEALFPLVSIGAPVIISSASQPATGYQSGTSTSWSQDKTVPGTGSYLGYPPSTGGSNTYVVIQGDTLWAIAQRFRIPINTLINLNNITNPHSLQPGQVLILA